MRSSSILALVYAMVLAGCARTPEEKSKPEIQPQAKQPAQTKPAAEKPAESPVLETARQLANTRYKGWTYGSNSKEKQVDCVQFLAEVVFEIAPQARSEKMRKDIYIDNLKEDEKNQVGFKRLLKSKDKRMTGVQNALVEAGLGKAVSISDVKPGDLVQYWIRLKNGNVMGHAAIIEHVRQGKSGVEVQIYGSHMRTNGIATADFWLPLIGEDREVFLVRMAK